jgi:hypothetical protein
MPGNNDRVAGGEKKEELLYHDWHGSGRVLLVLLQSSDPE